MSGLGKWFCVEVVEFKGHENVRATHKTTIEITREEYLTPKGDCIIGVKASKGLKDFSECFKELARRSTSRLMAVIIDSEGHMDIIKGEGSPELSFSDPVKMIIRRSSYASPNTVMINADKAARDLSRDLIKSLRKGVSAVAIFIAVAGK